MMGVQKIDVAQIADGGTYTAAPGTDRVLVFAGGIESAFVSRQIVGMTFGGVSCTEAVYEGSTLGPKNGMWYIKEADIPAGLNTLVVDYGGSLVDPFEGAAYTLGGVDQTIPVTNTFKSFASGASSLDLSVASLDGSFLIATASSNTSGIPLDFTATNTASTLVLVRDGVSLGEPAFSLDTLSSAVTTGASETVGLRYSGGTGDLVGTVAIFNAAAPTGPTTVTRNITLNPEATHEVIQTMAGVANTNPDQSIFGSTWVTVEDNQQARVPKVVDGVTFTWNDRGEFTTDQDKTVTFQYELFSPASGNWSAISLTVKDTSIIAVGMVTDMVASMVSNMVEDM